MNSSVALRALFLLVTLALIHPSYQQELFEDAVELEKSEPIFGEKFYSPAEENDIPDEGTSETVDSPLQRPDDEESPQNTDDSTQTENIDSLAHSYVNSEGYYVAKNGIDEISNSNIDEEDLSKPDNSVPYLESDIDPDEDDTTKSTDDSNSERQNRYDNEYVEKDTDGKFHEIENERMHDENDDMEMKNAEKEILVRPHNVERHKKNPKTLKSRKTEPKSIHKSQHKDESTRRQFKSKNINIVDDVETKVVAKNKLENRGKTTDKKAYEDEKSIHSISTKAKKDKKIKNNHSLKVDKNIEKNSETSSKKPNFEAKDTDSKKVSMKPLQDAEELNKGKENNTSFVTFGQTPKELKNYKEKHDLEAHSKPKGNFKLNLDTDPNESNEEEEKGIKQSQVNNFGSLSAKVSDKEPDVIATKIIRDKQESILSTASPTQVKKASNDEDHEAVRGSKDSPETVDGDTHSRSKQKRRFQELMPLDFAIKATSIGEKSEGLANTMTQKDTQKSSADKEIVTTKKDDDGDIPKDVKGVIPLDYATLESTKAITKKPEVSNKDQSPDDGSGWTGKGLKEGDLEEGLEKKKKQETPLGKVLGGLKPYSRKNKKKENILSKLPDAHLPKHSYQSNYNPIDKFDLEIPDKNPLHALPDIKPSKKPSEDEDIDEIFEKQENMRLENINLEATNVTYQDDMASSTENNGKMHTDTNLSGDGMDNEPLKDVKAQNVKRGAESGNYVDVNQTKQQQIDKDVERLEQDANNANGPTSGDFSSSEDELSTDQADNSNSESEGTAPSKIDDAPSINEPVVVLATKNEQRASENSYELLKDTDSSISGAGEGVSAKHKDRPKDNNNSVDDTSSGSNKDGESEFSGSTDDEDDSSGAERERREALTTEEKVNEAKAKLKHAEGASDALTNIEKEMGLDPSIAPEKTKHLTSELYNEIDKFKDIVTHQDDAVKRSKFQKLEKLAQEDVKGANDVMKMIVELEVAKYFAKSRARKKLELALRNRISKPPTQGQPPQELNPYQGMMPTYMQQFQDQSYTAPYGVYPPPVPFAPIPSPPKTSFQPPQVQNPLDERFLDNNAPQSWNPPVTAFDAPQNSAQDYSPYIGTPMSSAPQNTYPNIVPAAFTSTIPVSNPLESKNTNAANDNDKKRPKQKGHEEPSIEKEDKFLPKSSPFSGLKPLSLSSFKPIHPLHSAPSYSSDMKSLSAPLSPITEKQFPDEQASVNEQIKPFFRQSTWVPPSRINTFSDGLSRLNVNRQKPDDPKIAPSVKTNAQNVGKGLSNLFLSRAKPLTAHQFHPETPLQPPLQQQLYDANPTTPQVPPMYPQFQIPPPLESTVPVQRFNPQIPYYPQPLIQPAPLSYVSPQVTQPRFPEQKPMNKQYEGRPMDLNFNDGQAQRPQQTLPFQAPQVYPQQQAVNGFYGSFGMPGDRYSWPQAPITQGYGYQLPPSYEQQLINPLLDEAMTKIHDTKKAAQVVQQIEDKIGLSPPAVNHIIDDVESETKNEKTEFDQRVKKEQEKIHNEEKMINDVPDNENLKKKLHDEEKKLEDVRKRDKIAKVKLATIRKIEKILTVIESAKYSALKRAKEHLMRLKSEKDPQIRKRSLEALEKDLHKSEQRHVHRRNEINIWLKGSRNNINTSHFLEGSDEDKTKEQKHRFKTFGSPSIPKLAIANFAAKFTKKSNLTLPKLIAKKNNIPKSPRKQKIGVVLMRKLLQRMDDLYDMQSKILTQLVKDHQRAKDERDHMRDKRSSKKHHHNKKRHHRRHTRQSKR